MVDLKEVATGVNKVIVLKAQHGTRIGNWSNSRRANNGTIVRPGAQKSPELQNRISYLFPASFCPDFLSLVDVMSYYVVPILGMEVY